MYTEWTLTKAYFAQKAYSIYVVKSMEGNVKILYFSLNAAAMNLGQQICQSRLSSENDLFLQPIIKVVLLPY